MLGLSQAQGDRGGADCTRYVLYVSISKHFHLHCPCVRGHCSAKQKEISTLMELNQNTGTHFP